MKLFSCLICFLLVLNLSAQNRYSVQLTNMDKPEKTAVFNEGDRVIVYFNDTSEICGNLKAIDQSNLVVDSVTVPVNAVQIIVDRKPKSALFKIAGAGMVIGGAAITAGGFALLAMGLLPPSVESLYLVPAGLIADYFGVHFIIKGINKLGGKGKQYDIGYRYTMQIIDK